MQIAAKLGDEKGAREAVARLELIDKPSRYNHRLSTVERIFNHHSKALDAAEKAIDVDERPSFEMYAQLANCYIDIGDTDKAEQTLTTIDEKFGNIRRNIRIALKCRLLCRQSRFSDALLLSERIEDKNTIYYKKIRYEALKGELDMSALKDSTREEYRAELEALKNDNDRFSWNIVMLD